MTFRYDYKAAGQLLSDAGTKATVLLVIAMTVYGSDALFGRAPSESDPGEDAWDPAILFNQLEQDFSVSIPPENENKLQALLMAVATDAFYEDLETFMAVCNSVDSGDLGDLVNGFFEEVTVPEILWACYEVLVNRGSDTVEFSPPVSAFIEEIVSDEAEENEEVGDSVEEVTSYFDRFLREEQEELVSQLQTLGLPHDYIEHLRSMSPADSLDNTSVGA